MAAIAVPLLSKMLPMEWKAMWNGDPYAEEWPGSFCWSVNDYTSSMHKDDMNTFKGGSFWLLNQHCGNAFSLGSVPARQSIILWSHNRKGEKGVRWKWRFCQSQRQFVLKIVHPEARFFATEPNLGSSAGAMAGLPASSAPTPSLWNIFQWCQAINL